MTSKRNAHPISIFAAAARQTSAPNQSPAESEARTPSGPDCCTRRWLTAVGPSLPGYGGSFRSREGPLYRSHEGDEI